MDLTATVCFTSCTGAPAASEYTNRLGEPVPTELSRFTVALLVRNEATASVDAAGLAANAKTATPVT